MREESVLATVLGNVIWSAALAFPDVLKYVMFLSSQMDEISGSLLHAEASQGSTSDFSWSGLDSNNQMWKLRETTKRITKELWEK